MPNWDMERVRAWMIADAKRAQLDIEECKAKIRFGNKGYERFHDEAVAEQVVTDHLSVDASLENEGDFATKLRTLDEQVFSGGLDASGVYDLSDYRHGLDAKIDRIREVFLPNAEEPEDEIDPFNDIDGIIPGDIDNDGGPRDER